MNLLYDLHVHTWFSKDSAIDPKKIGRLVLQKGLNGIAVTDHSTIRGALESKFHNDTPINIIVGCEIKTEIGDIIGIFLNKEIKSRESADVVQEIEEQGGIVILPHPFHYHRQLPPYLLKQIDGIEVENARVSSRLNQKAKELACQGNLIEVGGSDAHFAREIGRVRTVIRNLKHNNDSSLKQAIILGQTEVIANDRFFHNNYYYCYISAILKRAGNLRPLFINLFQWL